MTTRNSRPIHAATTTLVPSVRRRAIDPSGYLGSFYDGWHDRVIKQSYLHFSPESLAVQESLGCYVEKVDTDGTPHLLKLINMHPELWLSVALEIIPREGIAALIDYSCPIDKYTRILIYYYLGRRECIRHDASKSKKRNEPSIPEKSATHVITKIDWGIDVVLVLQLLPDDRTANEIDHILQKICAHLEIDDRTYMPSQDGEHLLEQIVHTKIFSNISALANMKSLTDFYRNIPRFKNNSQLHCRLNYTIVPIACFFSLCDGKHAIFNELQSAHREKLEQYLLELLFTFKRLANAIDEHVSKLQQYLKKQFDEAHRRWSNLKQMYEDEIRRFQDLVIRIRGGHIDSSKIDQALQDARQKDFAKNISDFTDYLNGLKEKEHLISDLLRQQFEYYNAADCAVEKRDDEQTIASKLLIDGKCNRIVCSNDTLYQKKASQWQNLRRQLLKERDENAELRLIYLDFSYYPLSLEQIKLLPAIEKKNIACASTPMVSSSFDQSTNDEIINILLLGESGVGKSTFINAFVNYLTFQTLEQAQSSKPIVLIPGSFLITINDDFEERIVKFGKIDNASNEDHDHPGQSVTQHCKSYVFSLNDENGAGKKLRIIDTPGIGDTRGLPQDDLNMQHILSFISNLTHLNAVCILMKPNISRLNIYFRSCFTQLFDFLDENARNNIIFCFTNARATFYAPGNTAPLLKEMLRSLPIKGISFKKENTFCFDSESFRYLAAVQNGIKFSDDQKHECEVSWSNSVAQSNRLLQYIRTDITAYRITDERKSIKHAQLKIRHMIRPMLEAMRNILRNIVLRDAGLTRILVELCPKAIKRPKAICFSCEREPHRFENIWIQVDKPHDFENRCESCSCIPSKHIPIEYELGYNLSSPPEGNRHNDMKRMLDHLCQTSAEFAHFLMDSTGTSQNDPFLSGFQRMIKEEDDIRANKDPCHLNSNLFDKLENLKKGYEEIRKTMVTNHETSKLSTIYDRIESVSKYPMVESQMAAVQQWQNTMMKYHEREVQTRSIHSHS